MKPYKTFAAIAALIGGVIILAQLPYDSYFWDHAIEALFGVVLAAAGITYLWRNSRFYRGDS
ncbi:MAG: hypothetical protein ABSC77_12080 [Terracidiphilus sp.]|jgi:uncharacterized membrane protein YccC